MKKIIGFYHPSFPGGGAERVTLDIAKYLSKYTDEYEVHVLTPKLNSEYMSDDIARTVRIVVLPEDKAGQERVLTDSFRNAGIRILVQVGGESLPFLRKAADDYGAKIVFAHHNAPSFEEFRIIGEKELDSRKNIFKRLSWLLFRKNIYVRLGKARRKAYRIFKTQYDYSDVFMVLCDSYKREFENWFGIASGKGKFVTIYNPDIDVQSVRYEKKAIVLYVGRLNNMFKRVDRLLRIWKKVQARIPEYELKIVGDGHDRNKLEQLARRLRLERVIFEGYHTDVSEYYRDASVSCLVSSMEGWPLCLTEAQANGIIPIAFECCGGISEILSPSGENGFLVKAFNEDRFADTLIRVINLPEEEKQRLRQNVVRKSKTHPVEEVCGQWKTLFDRLLS